MKEKVQKIREEVEKLKSNLMYGACSSQVAMETRCKEESYNEVLAILDSMQEEPVSGLDNGDMPVERWKQAVKAASNQRSYRSSKGLTETRDDYFVDGVQWADEHPKEEPTAKIRGWVARQPEGELWLFAESPYYNSSLGSWGTAIGGERVLEGINTTMFKDLNFYDEPIEVELIIRKV